MTWLVICICLLACVFTMGLEKTLVKLRCEDPADALFPAMLTAYAVSLMVWLVAIGAQSLQVSQTGTLGLIGAICSIGVLIQTS
jgi:hypothetical protein